jgi:hypothetical protein
VVARRAPTAFVHSEAAYPVAMISRPLALRLREAGLVWRPAAGDRFQFLTQDMESTGTDAFTVSDMTIEAHTYPTGTVLGFNGTTEWALDSVAIEEALWLPREDQLREALRGTFERLERDAEDGGWRVTCTFLGQRMSHLADTPEDAYAMAVLAEVEASA